MSRVIWLRKIGIFSSSEVMVFVKSDYRIVLVSLHGSSRRTCGKYSNNISLGK
jgi:hypothetical protein